MKSLSKTIYLGAILSTTLLANPAIAGSVFMLQFGSFQTNEEAQAHLTTLKNKHVGALSRLSPAIRQVQLPPDDLTVYRTQAGPLATRGDAQSVCSQLVSNGDECYVIEVAEKPAATTPSVHVPRTVEKVTPPVVETVGRDPQHVAMLNSITAPPAAPAVLPKIDDAPANDVTTDAEQTVREALDAAAEKKEETRAAIEESASGSNGRSFWDRINPFSSDTPEETVAAPVEEAVAAPIAPPMPEAPRVTESLNISNTAPSVVAINPAPPTPKIVASAAPRLPAPPVPQTPVVVLPPSPLTSTPETPPVALGSVPTSQPVAPVYPMPLPPPPLPMNKPPAPPISTAVLPPPARIDSRPLLPPPGVAPIAPSQLSAARGNVRVEEARRVPLTTAPQLPPPPVVTPIPPAATPLVDLSPNSTLGQRTLWAEIGAFDTTQNALSFWNNYRLSHPDFPVVRVRVTSPLAQQQRSITSVSLRVGPFKRPEFITILCNSLKPEEVKHCGRIADLGVAASPFAPSQDGFLRSSRYTR